MANFFVTNVMIYAIYKATAALKRNSKLQMPQHFEKTLLSNTLAGFGR